MPTRRWYWDQFNIPLECNVQTWKAEWWCQNTIGKDVHESKSGDVLSLPPWNVALSPSQMLPPSSPERSLFVPWRSFLPELDCIRLPCDVPEFPIVPRVFRAKEAGVVRFSEEHVFLTRFPFGVTPGSTFTLIVGIKSIYSGLSLQELLSNHVCCRSVSFRRVRKAILHPQRPRKATSTHRDRSC